MTPALHLLSYFMAVGLISKNNKKKLNILALISMLDPEILYDYLTSTASRLLVGGYFIYSALNELVIDNVLQ